MKTAQRPYIICHMLPSIDGRIVPGRWKLADPEYADYERTAQSFAADAWIIGRVSMAKYTSRTLRLSRKRVPPVPRRDFIAPHDATSYAIAIDPSGKLAWKSDAIDGEHVITVLTEQVTDEYLTFLRTKGVSYIFGGKTRIDLARVVRKLRSAFAIKRLLVEGGGKINGSFLEADLLDELSVLIAPVADGSVGTPSLFDAEKVKGPVRRLKLLSVEKLADDFLWLRYEVRHAGRR